MDIDIDLADRKQLLEKINHRVAVLKNGKPHNTGIYVTEIPHNPLTKVSTIDYKQAEKRNYFKIDILNLSVYQGVRNEEHLVELMNQEPLWELLHEPEFTENLFHVSGHHGIMKQLNPRTIEQLAMALAIIRPAKKHLINSDWDTIAEQVWLTPTDGSYAFKRSHALAYAYTVVLHMNLMVEKYQSEGFLIS